MLGVRVNQYVVNGQFWFMQELGDFSVTKNFLKAVVVVSPEALVSCTLLACNISTSSASAPSLALQSGGAFVSAEIIMSVFEERKPSKILQSWSINATLVATAAVQPSASETQVLAITVNPVTNLGLPAPIAEILKKVLDEHTSRNVTLPGALTGTQLTVGGGWIQMNTDIVLK